MSVLGEPLYEVAKESQYYKDRFEYRRLQPIVGKLVEDIEDEFMFKRGSLVIWSSNKFGLRNREDQMSWNDQLKVNYENEGTRLFKKRSKNYKELQEKIKTTDVDTLNELVNPFTFHDICGMNNCKSSHWVSDRWFFEVKDEDRLTTDGSPDYKKADWNEYIELLKELKLN